MVERAAEKAYKTLVSSSPRWAHFTHRPGDIFVCTPPKTGTTWTQGIVRSLMAGRDEPDGDLTTVHPWLEARFEPIEDVVARLDAQTHRRSIKSHTPADGIPLFADAQYVVVYRDLRDAFMSWVNHLANMRADRFPKLVEEAAADGVDLSGFERPDDLHGIFRQWITAPPQVEHLETWWPLRAEPNVTVIHYNDLLTDLEGEMRLLADWLDIQVPADAWPRVVGRCTIDEMREAARGSRVDDLFEGGADTFFNKGTNGRWRGVLTDDELSAVDALVADRLDPRTAAWLEHGSLAVGNRPDAL